MAVTLNKIHSNNTLITSDDDAFYVYSRINVINGNETVTEYKWLRDELSAYYKFYNIKLEDVENIVNFNYGDFALLYSSKNNEIKWSEDITSNPWKIVALKKMREADTERYNCPQSHNTVSQEINSNSSTQSTETAHYIEQPVQVECDKRNIFSYLVKAPSVSGNCNVSIGFFNYLYNIGLNGKFDLKTGEEKGIFYTDTNYNIISEPTSLIDSNSCIQTIENYEDSDGNIYYKISIEFVSKINGTMYVRLNLLNSNSDFVYKPIGSENYTVILCGAQFEIRDVSDNGISTYIYTTNKPAQFKTLDSIYRYNGHSFDICGSVYYIKSAVETSLDGRKIIESSIPDIVSGDHAVNDIALIPSMLNINQSGVGTSLGNSSSNSVENLNVESLIYYDKTKHAYYIRVKEIIDDAPVYKWKLLANKTISKTSKEIINAILFNTTRYETWSKCTSAFNFKRGFNTGGGRNFWGIKR